MPLNKKIVAFDLDGTLTESKQQLQSEMAHQLVQLQSIAKVVIISGGSMEQYKKQFLPFISDVSNLILLPTSGSQRYEYDSATKEWIKTDEVVFPGEIKSKIIEAFSDVETSGKYDIPAEHFGERIEDRGDQITFSALGQLAPVDKKSTWDPDQNKRKKIVAVLEKQFPEVTFGIGGMTSIDVLPKGFNKARNLERQLLKLSLEKSDLIYVGDAVFPGGNDYSLYEDGIETVAVGGPSETAVLIQKWLQN